MFIRFPECCMGRQGVYMSGTVGILCWHLATWFRYIPGVASRYILQGCIRLQKVVETKNKSNWWFELVFRCYLTQYSAFIFFYSTTFEDGAKKCTKFRWFFGGWENLVFCFRYLLTFTKYIHFVVLIFFVNLFKTHLQKD